MVKEELYSDEIVKILTNGIGVELGRPIRFRYYELKNRFIRKLNTSIEWLDDWNEKNTQIAIDIIALSVFHQRVIVPFYGSSNFLTFLNNYKINSVAMGTYSLGSDDRGRMTKCTKAFYAITKKIKLSPRELNISSVEELIELFRRKSLAKEVFKEDLNDE